MRSSAQDRAGELDAVLAAALEAAADRVGRRVQEVILQARLATAIHMCRAAEPTAARTGDAEARDGSIVEAALTDRVCAASGLRTGGRP